MFVINLNRVPNINFVEFKRDFLYLYEYFGIPEAHANASLSATRLEVECESEAEESLESMFARTSLVLIGRVDAICSSSFSCMLARLR